MAEVSDRLYSKGTWPRPWRPSLKVSKTYPHGFCLSLYTWGTLLANAAGKRGHKGKVQKNTFLIMASELVRLKTGNHYDEHLAELLQTVNPMIDVNEQEDISGDSIRKKREHIKKAYPLIYADCVNKIRSRGA